MVTSSGPGPSRAPLRVLVVEDSRADAELLLDELARHGFDVSWDRVDTEAAYLERLGDLAPHLVLSDFNLPQFSAARALDLLHERRLEIPFIVVSGTIGEETAVAMMKHGATDYLLKDHLSRLGPMVARALQGHRRIAYFSMEIALESAIPTYSGGLGVLAGDTIRSAADLGLPVVAISLVHRLGYFRQRVNDDGWQVEEPIEWDVRRLLTEMPQRVSITLERRVVDVRAWRYDVKGTGGKTVPVYLLDTDLESNAEWDRRLTDCLYGGDAYYRLCQEVVLGIGGVRLLRALGYNTIERFHMNEGHASLLTLELLREEAARGGRTCIDLNDVASVRQRCLFTTHTPVPAGHDRFPLDLASRVLGYHEHFSDLFGGDTADRIFGQRPQDADWKTPPPPATVLNMTLLGLNMSRYVNGVAKKHGEISRLMFAGYQIDAITNGVHVGTWTSPSFQALYDCHIPDWRQDNFSLRRAESLQRSDVWNAHLQAKGALFQRIRKSGEPVMDVDRLTLGFARRATAYKRADLLFFDESRLRQIAAQAGGLQIVYAGKAHPSDHEGKLLIQRIVRLSETLKDDITIAFVPNYDVDLAKLITSGVDIWLNTPQPPLEASGTSGMKAALNGVPSLSILDGWWIEGAVNGVTGWAIGNEQGSQAPSDDRSAHANALYERLEQDVVPIFCDDRDRFIDIMRHTIALNGSYFNTQRMLQQYVVSAYFG